MSAFSRRGRNGQATRNGSRTPHCNAPPHDFVSCLNVLQYYCRLVNVCGRAVQMMVAEVQDSTRPRRRCRGGQRKYEHSGDLYAAPPVVPSEPL